MENRITQEIYLIAGERSGDNIGAKLIQALQQQHNNKCTFRGVGGEAMIAEGFVSIFPFSKISLFGFVEILPHIFTIMKLIKQVVDDIIKSKVKIVVTIDAPGFNFRVAELLRKKKHHIKLVHYVAPTVWAYKEKRAAKCAKLFDHMLTLFDFETPYFTKYGLATSCVGHPLFDYDYNNLSPSQFRQQYNIKQSTKVICITPGSRRSEITRHMPVLLELISNITNKINDVQVFMVAANTEIMQLIQKYVAANIHKIIIINDEQEKLLLYKTADLAIAKSGTNTLEIAACKTPIIVFYAINNISWLLLKFMLKIKYASIINIIAQAPIIPEFIQYNFNATALTEQAMIYLEEKQVVEAQLTRTHTILTRIGLEQNIKSSDKAAKIILAILLNEKLA